jgi:hypothetical protein
MERGIGFAVLLLVCSTALSNEVVFECGKSSPMSFNGWSVYPYNGFSEVEFTEEMVAFHVEDGGEYTIMLTRQIEAMRSYSRMRLDVEFGAIKNCVLNFIDVYVSADGKNWKSIPLEQNDLGGIIENNAEYQYLRIAANVSFYKNGYIECSYVRLEGEEPAALTETPEEPIEDITEFFIF